MAGARWRDTRTMPPIASPLAAIVDLDGTLVDTLADFHAALAASHRDLGLRVLEPGEVELLVGKGSEHLVRSALQVAGAQGELYEQAWHAYQRHYDACNGLHSAPYPGAVGGVGQVKFSPNSRNVLPGTVVFTVDIRSPNQQKLDGMRARIEAPDGRRSWMPTGPSAPGATR